MDVFCGGMYRACSTWQYQVASHLLEQRRRTIKLGYLTGEEFAARDDSERGETGEVWRIVKSHEEHPRFRRILARGRGLVLYSHRDIRDVIFSLMHKRRMSFETILKQGMIHQVIANDRFWSTQPGVLIQRYDDLIADPARCVNEIAAHLGLELVEGVAEEVARLYSFEANRARAEAIGARLRAHGAALDDPAFAQAWDRDNLLHWNHLREGRTGDWRIRASAGQRLVLSRLCDGWLRDHGYEVGPTDPRAVPVEERRASARDMRRGWVACFLRCASLRFPRVAHVVKRCLGLNTAPHPFAAPVSVPPSPHFIVPSQPVRSAEERP